MVVFPHSGELGSLRENEGTLKRLIWENLQDALQRGEQSTGFHLGGKRIKHVFAWKLQWVELYPSKRYVHILTPSTCDCDLI